MHPFTNNPREAISRHGERSLLRLIRRWLGPATPPPPFGLGDDCAVLPKTPPVNLVTVDALFYGRHFDDTISPEAAGGKLLKKNLSDIAAMGGTPSAAVLGLVLPPNLKTEWLRRFYAGLRREAKTWRVAIVGGDLCESAQALGGHLTLLGFAARPVTRAGARVGDHLLVTGSLGGSILGWHFKFAPRLPEGRWLAAQPAVRAMIDVTDGLAKDLPELLPERSAAALELGQLPISPAALKLAARTQRSACWHALCDGEDYELLLALDGRADLAAFGQAWQKSFKTPLTVIGRIIKHRSSPPRPILDHATSKPLALKGYEHFGKT